MSDFIKNLADFLFRISNGNVIVLATYAGAYVTLLTSLGAMVAIFAKNLPKWSVDFSMAFAAGVMLVASFTSLILPAIEYSKSFTPVAIGIILGIFLIYIVDKSVPHEHLVKGYEGPKEFKDKIRVAWLIAFAVIIHNLPEGMAVGTSISFDLKSGLITSIAIGIQDFPEGIVVSLPLAVLGKKRFQAIMLGVFSGVVEWVMAILGAVFFSIFHFLLPYGLGLAGGAMLYVTIKEMVPEIYKGKTSETLISVGFFLGFYVMLFLDSMLG